MLFASNRKILTQGCDGCELRPECGGLPHDDFFGCFDRCHSRITLTQCDANGVPIVGRHSKQKPHCANSECDWTCPNNPKIFAQRWAEVEGLFDFRHESYLPISGRDWPRYMPMIRSGPPRLKPLKCSFVTLSLYECMRALRKGKGYESPGPIEFRRRLALRDDCRIILVGVGPDKLIEGFYAKFRELKLAEIFATLDLVAVTTPNFSYFLDVPRPHSLYNRKRMLRVADEFLRHGVAVAPHFNATFRADWDFWISLLRNSPSLSVYCKEFQTGNRRKVNYEPTLSEMLRLQESVGRALHPILVAGKKSLPALLPHLKSFTVVDSDPSLKTNHRQVLKNGRWESLPCPPGACLTDLMDHNIEEHAKIFENRLASASTPPTRSIIPARPAPPQKIVLELERFFSPTSPLPEVSLK